MVELFDRDVPLTLGTGITFLTALGTLAVATTSVGPALSTVVLAGGALLLVMFVIRAGIGASSERSFARSLSRQLQNFVDSQLTIVRIVTVGVASLLFVAGGQAAQAFGDFVGVFAGTEGPLILSNIVAVLFGWMSLGGDAGVLGGLPLIGPLLVSAASLVPAVGPTAFAVIAFGSLLGSLALYYS